jgi:hypothetical protein
MLKAFPKTSIHVLDFSDQNSLYEFLGPQIGSTILQEFNKKGVQIYGKVKGFTFIWNHLSKINNNTPTIDIRNITDSIKLRID